MPGQFVRLNMSQITTRGTRIDSGMFPGMNNMIGWITVDARKMYVVLTVGQYKSPPTLSRPRIR